MRAAPTRRRPARKRSKCTARRKTVSSAGTRAAKLVPLVQHAQAVHQDLLGAEQLAETPRMLDVLRREAKRPRGPAQQVKNVSRVSRSSISSRSRCVIHSRAIASRGSSCAPLFALAVQLIHALARELPAAHEHFPERPVRTRPDRGGGNDGSAIEQELDRLVVARELERAGLALLPDQLEDLGDAELSEISVDPPTR